MTSAPPLESIYVPRPNIGMTTPSFNVIVEDNPVGIGAPDDMTESLLQNNSNHGVSESNGAKQ